METPKQREEYSWHLKQLNEDGSEWWVVENTKTNRGIDCSSESACEKIVSLAISIRDKTPKPLQHSIMEKKAKWLQRQYKIKIRGK